MYRLYELRTIGRKSYGFQRPMYIMYPGSKARPADVEKTPYVHVEKTLYVRILEYQSMHNTIMAYYYSSMHTSSLYNTSY